MKSQMDHMNVALLKQERDQDDAGINLVRCLASNPDFLLYLMSSTTQMTLGPGNHDRDNATFKLPLIVPILKVRVIFIKKNHDFQEVHNWFVLLKAMKLEDQDGATGKLSSDLTIEAISADNDRS